MGMCCGLGLFREVLHYGSLELPVWAILNDAHFGVFPMFLFGGLWQVFIQVDEKGTEAAAVTAVVFNESAEIPTRTPEVVFDRPFLFVVVDDTSGNVLFLGAVKDPSKAAI